ncbi:MAG: nuclear transport factor 2 family protein [Acidobacteria bacterium]|nr:nuclear transport factor 2 family protein [Acidobacteriota bacterium]
MHTLKITRRPMLFLTAFFLFFAPLFVQAAPVQEEAKEIQAHYSELDKAIKDKKIEAMASVITEDFKFQSKDGRSFTNKQTLQLTEQMFSALQTVHESVSKVEKVEEGDDATTLVATVKQTLKGTITGPDGKPHELVVVTVSKDHWVDTEDGWKMKASTTIEETSTLDGKPMQ